jgi:hypothetical protein
MQYIPGTSSLAKTEAKILAKYIFDNFSDNDRYIAIEETRTNLIDLINKEINEKEIELKQKENELKQLIKLLKRITNEENSIHSGAQS